MSILAKIFVIINLVLAFVFVSVTAALYHHRVSWREQFEKLQSQYTNLRDVDRMQFDYYKNVIKSQQDQINREVRQQERLLQFNAELKHKVRDARTQLAIESQEMALLLREHARIVAILATKDRTIEGLRSENKLLTEKVNEMIRKKDTAEKQVVRLSRIRLYYEKALADLRQELARVRRELDTKCLIIERLVIMGIPVERLVSMTPPAKVDTTVKAYDPETQLVVLGAGSEDKVAVGDGFIVYRGNRFIARVLVERVWPNYCGGRVQFMASDAAIQNGDRATTWLP